MTTNIPTIPQDLYKYRSMGPEGSAERNHVQRIFTHHEVYFSSPADFNDPFDCQVHCSFDGSDREWEDYFVRIQKQVGSQTPEPILRRCAKQSVASGRHSDPKTHQRMLRDLQREANGLGVFCVSAKADSLAMWSKYAAGHRGLCLELEHRKNLFSPSAFHAAFPVTYSSTVPQISLLHSDSTEIMEANLLTKSADWREEHEHRFIDNKNGPGLRTFNPAYLSAVIFGCRMSSDDRQAVRDWIAQGETRPALHESIAKEGELAVELRRVSP